MSGCLPMFGYRLVPHTNRCETEVAKALANLVADKRITIVILHGRWTSYYEGSRFDNGEGGVELARMPAQVFDASFKASKEPFRASLESIIVSLQRAGKQVVLVYPVPEVGWHVPKLKARRILAGQDAYPAISTPFAVFQKRVQKTYSTLDRVTGVAPITRARPETAFCNTLLKARCVAEHAGHLLYFDDNHLNPKGAALAADVVIKAMAAAKL
jgi:hypothetical protein